VLTLGLAMVVDVQKRAWKAARRILDKTGKRKAHASPDDFSTYKSTIISHFVCSLSGVSQLKNTCRHAAKSLIARAKSAYTSEFVGF